MIAALKTGGHYVIGLAVIGAISALIAVGQVSAAAGLPLIAAVGSALIGGGIATKGAPTVVSNPAPPVQAMVS